LAEGEAAEWYHLAEGGWVRSEAVETYQDETAARQAAAQALCSAGGEATATAVIPPTAEADYPLAPAAVWNLGAVAPPDNVSGECLSSANYVPPYGPASFTYDGQMLVVQTQEPGSAYVFRRVAANVYNYTGPTAMGDGVVTMTLTFTSAITARMTRVFTPQEDPACQHTYYYSVTHMWDR